MRGNQLVFLNIYIMKYLQIYENFGELEYEEFYMFDYRNSPKFSNFQTISKSIHNDVCEILNKNMRLFFDYLSRVKISKFYTLDWPVYLKSFDTNLEDSEEWQEWKNEWKSIFDKTFDKDVRIFDNKCITFNCKPHGIHYKNYSTSHYVSIIKDDDDYYYVTIRLGGTKRHFKCDQEYGLENCLKTELINKKGFERDLE
jgi:hypothetical protein